jgi:hypothetical protein
MPSLPLCYCTRDDPRLDFRDIMYNTRAPSYHLIHHTSHCDSPNLCHSFTMSYSALLPSPRPARITRQVAWQHIMRFNRDLATVYKLRAEFVAGIMVHSLYSHRSILLAHFA